MFKMATALRRSVIQVVRHNKYPASSALKTNFSTVENEKNIIKSVYKDIPTLNCSVNEFVWHNLDRWPDKTATVSSLFLLQCHKPNYSTLAETLNNKLEKYLIYLST